MSLILNPLTIQQKLKNALMRYLVTRAAIHSEYLRDEIKRQLLDKNSIAQDVYIQLLKDYRKGSKLKDISIDNKNILHPNFSSVVNQEVNEERKGFNVNWELFTHQEEAIKSAFLNKNIIVASGTGSGKTESFLIPIINRLLKEPRHIGSNGVRCVILYPMNALVNDQIKRIRDWLGKTEENEHNLTFAYYTSKTPNEPHLGEDDECYCNELRYRTQIRTNPPDILVTNYSMLSYILMRPSDRMLFDNSLSMIVLDEAHIYSGALATEIRLLIHHLALRSQISTSDIQFFLTSATLTSASYSEEQQKRILKDFASKLTNTSLDSWTSILSKENIRKFEYTNKDENIPKLIQGGKLIDEILSDKLEDDFNIEEIENQLQDLEECLSLRLNFSELEDILEYGGLDNIKKFINNISSKIGNKLYSSNILFHLMERLNNDILTIDDLSEYFPDVDKKELIYLITLLNFASKDGKSLLPYRGHLFFRSPVGLFSCSNPDCRPDIYEGNLKRWKRIFLERFDYCPICNSKVVELATCNECGLEFAIGKIKGDRSHGKLIHLRPRDWLDIPEAHHLLFDPPEVQEWASDLEDDEIESSIDESKNWNRYLFCYKCGTLSSLEDGLVCDCGNNYSLEVYNYMPNKDYIGKDHSISSCPRCKKRKTAAGSPVQRFGGRETVEVTVLMSELHQHLPPEKQTQNTIASGRKMLAFSDTRSRAAKLAVNLNINERDILFRSYFLKSMNKLGNEHPDKKITFLELLEDLRSQISDLPIYRELGYIDPKMVNWDIIMKAVILARITIDSWKRSLEGMGLINVRIPLENFNFSDLISISWSESSIKNLIEYILWTLRITHSLYFREVISRNPNEIYKAILEGKELVGFVKREKEIASPRIQNFISQSNRRFKYLKKQGLKNNEIEDLLTKIWEFLKKSKLIHLEQGHFQKKQYFLDPTELNFTISQTVFLCDTCGRVFPFFDYSSKDQVCYHTFCSGHLTKKTFSFIEDTILKDNHYFYLYNSTRLPLICREHTAQIGNEVQDQYEKEFRDGRINLLSCSTTMELGIDIGGVSTVVGSNVPPRISNYVQRVGRAGRAGAGVAAAITFSRGQSYEQYAYEHPAYYIKGEIEPPIVEPNLPPVIKRHINLYLLASFFQRYGYSVDFSHNGLRLKEIFEKHNDKSMIEDFIVWLQQGKDEASDETLATFLPQNSTEKSSDLELSKLRLELIDNLKTIQDNYITKINELQYAINKEVNKSYQRHLINEKERIEGEMVIRHFCYNQIFPQFSFPVDVVSLIDVSDNNIRSAIDEGEVRLQRDVKLALREYSPGNVVVADSKMYKSNAVRWGEFGTVSNKYSKANVSFFIKCPNGHLQVSQLSTQKFPDECPTCKKIIPSMYKVEKFLKPTAFSTSWQEEAKVITSVTPFEMGSELSEPLLFDNVSLSERNYQAVDGISYLKSFFARSGKGEILYYTKSNYRVCKACGFSVRKDKIDERKWNEHYSPVRNTRCLSQDYDELHFGTSKKTDILYLRIEPSEIKNFNELNKNTFWYTILQLILETIPGVLNIDRRDIDGLIWTNENLVSEMILFDDVPNGAGHMKIVQNNLKIIFDEAKKRIAQDCCDRACPKCLLTFYNQHFDELLDKNIVNRFFELN